MIENLWQNASNTSIEEALSVKGRLSKATEAAEKAAGDGKLYFCVIDRLSYGSLDTALVHVKMQHGMAFHGELLLRTKMVGGAR